MSRCNDEFINSKYEENILTVWTEINKEYNLINSKEISESLINVNLTYEYIEDFVPFAKSKNKYICMAALCKNAPTWSMESDLDKLLKYKINTFNISKEQRKYNKLYYVDYKFADDYNCKHGKDFKDVYLVFLADDENQICFLLEKFKKLKAFI